MGGRGGVEAPLGPWGGALGRTFDLLAVTAIAGKGSYAVVVTELGAGLGLRMALGWRCMPACLPACLPAC